MAKKAAKGAKKKAAKKRYLPQLQGVLDGAPHFLPELLLSRRHARRVSPQGEMANTADVPGGRCAGVAQRDRNPIRAKGGFTWRRRLRARRRRRRRRGKPPRNPRLPTSVGVGSWPFRSESPRLALSPATTHLPARADPRRPSRSRPARRRCIGRRDAAGVNA